MEGNNKKPILPLHVRGKKKNPGNYILRFGTLEQELEELFRVRINPGVLGKLIVLTIGMLLTPISCIGLMLGFNWAYMKFMFPKDEIPRLHSLPQIVRISMGLGLIFAWIATISLFMLLYKIAGTYYTSMSVILVYLGVNAFLSFTAYVLWRKWRLGIENMLAVSDSRGSAHWASQEEMKDYIGTDGLYLGGHYRMNHKGHVALFGSARSGKNVYLLINAILGVGGYKSSQVILDPKGELYAITAAALKRMKKRVICINPFGLLPDHIKERHTYNPLDFIADKSDPNIVDEIATLAEGIVPKVSGDRNAFFTNSGRNLISIILLHLICSAKGRKATISDLWAKLRLAGEDWDNFILELATSNDPVHGETIKRGASEIMKYMGAEEMWSSIISTALEATNIFQSKAMQESLQSGFDPYSLATNTDTIVFITIPAQALISHGAYLRIVISSILQSVVKQPGQRVTLIADEAASLGYMSIIENGLAVFAGFNITLFLVYQDLAQVKAIFKDK
jgi:type IV secretion system protein VirD4